MLRTTNSQRAVDLFGPGRDGFRNGDASLGVIATRMDAANFNDYQEEMLNVIEYAGLTPDARRTQLREAIAIMIANSIVIDPDDPIGYRPYIATAGDFNVTGIHVGAVIEFTAPGKTCNLLEAVANQNGFPLTIKHGGGAGDTTIAAFAGQLIDGKASVLLRAGDQITIVCTGSTWRIIGGRRTYRSPGVPYAVSQKYTWTHGLGVEPTKYRVRLRCTTAEQGWAVGNMIDITPSAIYYTYGWTQHLTDTQMIFITQHVYTPGINHKSTGAEFELTAAYWDVFCDLEVVY